MVKNTINIKRIIFILLIFLFIIIFNYLLPKIIYGAFNDSINVADFKTDPKMFCTNRGYMFNPQNRYFQIAKISTGKNITKEWDSSYPANSIAINLNKIFSNIDNIDYKIAYILYCNKAIDSKSSIGATPTQVAIWKLLTPDKALPSTSKPYISTGNGILDRAKAYANFVNEIKDYDGAYDINLIKCDGFQTGSNGYIGPFKLTYVKGVDGDYEYGDPELKMTYGTSNVDFGIYLKKSDGSFKQLESVPDSGDKFYVKINNSQTGTYKLKAIQDGLITTTFTIWHTPPTTSNIEGYYTANIDGKQIYVVDERR